MNNNRPSEHDNDLFDDSTETSSELMPRPDTERQAPPRDIDEREDHELKSAPIELPAHKETERTDSSGALHDQIDNLLPRPAEDEYHDDDTTAPDPYNVDDQVDLHMPRTLASNENPADDFSTWEELDVDSAPADRTDFMQRSDAPEDVPDAVTEETSSSEQDDHEPINTESAFFASSSQSGSADDVDHTPESEVPDQPSTMVAQDEQETLAEAEETEDPVPPPSGTTTCPVCGHQTDALRFCGFCGSQLTEERRELSATSIQGRIQERSLMLLSPLADWTRPGTVRLIMAVGALLVLISLLTNSGAMALILGSTILPLILVFWCLNNDIFENESPLIIAGFGLAGTLVGAILGWLSSIIVTSSWFDTGVLNFGAAGFGGQFAERSGSPPFLVWSLVGIVFPLLALVAIIGGPLAMRQTITLRNEVMDGLTLGAAMGAGYSFGTAIVFAAPMLINGGPIADASTWTLTTIGLTVIRPLIWTLSGGMLGAAAWRYLLTGRIGNILIPGVIGIAAPLLFTLMSIELSPTGVWPEIIWGLVVAAIVSFFYKITMNQALEQDRKILGANDSRVICPVCHQVTPTGQFCAHCGAALH